MVGNWPMADCYFELCMCMADILLGECMALWGEPNDPSSYTYSVMLIHLHVC